MNTLVEKLIDNASDIITSLATLLTAYTAYKQVTKKCDQPHRDKKD